ncbi:MAG: glycosyltransferase [Myxacorys californica WJT36-NPBG1]|jgi:glycosyltransferase involved in cell wall biosynthesis|nr:glycosyltransferase [Myxacorys californica WJT36-NPBG1]
MNVKGTSISIFLPNLDGGGAERAMLHLAQGFAERGIKTDLVLAEAEGDYLELVPSSVRVIDLKSTFPVVVWKTVALSRYLQHENPTVIFSALDIISSALWAKKWARQVTVPTKVVMCVQTYLSGQFQHDQHYVAAYIRTCLVRWLYPKSDALVAASWGTAKDLAHLTALPLDRIQVIYNPVVTPDVIRKSQEPLAHPWFLPGEPPVVLGVGRLVGQKDFFTLIQAFQRVRQQRRARLIILGEGEDRPRLETLIRELKLEQDVALLGFVENPYVYMANSAVFVLSSHYEGFGNVVAEAMAVGTPIVATDCPSGPAEILENGKYGKLVPIADPDFMATAILETLAHPVNSEVLKARSLLFSSDHVVTQYVDVIEQILQNS